MSRNLVYAPWSPSNLQLALDGYIERKTRFLYLELSAKCTKCNCLYCDSPKHIAAENELSIDEIKFLIDEFADRGLMWLFICGLGEPSEDEKLLPLLSYLREKRIKASFFTNGLGFVDSDIQFLKECNAHLALKLDTFQQNIFDRLLGTRGSAKRIYSFLESLLEQGFVRVNSNYETNLAISIVPTALNIYHIPEVVRYCVEHSIYPAIGEMEPIGNAMNNISLLKVSKYDLMQLYYEISNILRYSYFRPLCPVIISDFRIDHTGNFLIDATTGLGCGWFMEQKYRPLILGNIRKDCIDEIQNRGFLYRYKSLSKAVRKLRCKNPVIASGGGSRPVEWVELYTDLIERTAQRTGSSEHTYSSSTEVTV